MNMKVIEYDYESNAIRSRANTKQERESKINNHKRTLLNKIFPGADILSWGFSAATIWTWLTAGRVGDAHKAGLPPTIVIDRHDMPHHKVKIDNSISVMHGENLRSYSFYGVPEIPETIKYLCPTKTEIRIYQRSYDRNVKEIWGGRAPIVVHQTLMAHVLLHEMFHYIKESNLWMAQFEDGADEAEAYRRYVHHVFDRVSTAEDEIENEAITLWVLQQLMVEGLDGVMENGIIPKIGGRYDLWRRSRDPEYERRMDAFEVVAATMGGYYMGNDVDYDRISDLIDKQRAEAIKEHVHVFLVD